MVLRALVLLIALAIPRSSHADPWYRGKYGHNRVVHVAVTGTALGLFATSALLEPQLARGTCRWCAPDGFDVSVRDALVWHDTRTASILSSGVAATVPALELSLLGATALSGPGGSTARFIDDTLPVAETVALSELGVQIVKFTVGRERPFIHFGPTGAIHKADDDVSFFSAHSTLVFGVVVSAGVIAHRRHEAVEPYVWGVGMALAATTGYLRIAADKHYITDVLVGAAVGATAGIAVPRLMSRDGESAIVPTGTGAMYVRVF